MEQESIEQIEKQPCPARTEYGCAACGLLRSPTCFGKHLIAAENRQAALSDELDGRKSSLKKERQNICSLRKKVRAAEKKAADQAADIRLLEAKIKDEERRIQLIQQPDSFKKKVRNTTLRRQKYIRGMARKNAKDGNQGEKKSLCGDCRICTCTWMLCGKPVEGWTAEPSQLYKNGWIVLDCPEAKL